MENSHKKLEKCEVCDASQAKYTCPKCEVRTCCLDCVNIHKTELDCDGIRDRTKFIPRDKFTDLDMLNDYRLLEDIGRSVELLRKNPVKQCTRLIDPPVDSRSFGQDEPKPFNLDLKHSRPAPLPIHLQRLKDFVRRRGVTLEFMPKNFKRHQDNTTFLKWKTRELFWKIEFIFSQAENTKRTIERVPDTTRLSDIIENIFDSDNNLRSKLQFYIARGISGLKVLLKAEKVKKSDSRFYELDLTETLKDNLRNKTIIEFPIIYVILKEHIDMYEIIASDDEEEVKEESNSYNSRLKRPNRSNQNPVKRKRDEIKLENNFFNLSHNSNESASDEEEQRELHIPTYDELVKTS